VFFNNHRAFSQACAVCSPETGVNERYGFATVIPPLQGGQGMRPAPVNSEVQVLPEDGRLQVLFSVV
jgi:hypothetical protein